MPLKDEKIQDNRIRPTAEIGCQGTYWEARCAGVFIALKGATTLASSMLRGLQPPTDSLVFPQIQTKDDFLVVHLARALEAVAFVERDR
jgi:hypothetical protein